MRESTRPDVAATSARPPGQRVFGDRRAVDIAGRVPFRGHCVLLKLAPVKLAAVKLAAVGVGVMSSGSHGCNLGLVKAGSGAKGGTNA